ncbi:MAG: Gfo/Idh/MocA family oxidoreductase [Planctomycetes bacterium]|nr:Gfo/Idh/MocA family oxidoreductase [Planctomycetota bacterium]
MAKLRVGVVGVGPMGQGHVKHYKGLAGCELVAVSDMDPARRAEAATKSGAMAFSDPTAMIGRVDAVSIATPTVTHLELALRFIDAGVHVLVEKPMAASSREAEEMVEAARRKGVVLQVGHIERFNPAFKAAKAVLNDPRYVIADRLSPYSFRSRDIGVVHDLMIHDLDILLEFIDDDVASLEAIGIPVLSHTEDMVDARLRLRNGALADIRSSRVSMKKMRKIRVFQSDGYVSIDYGANALSIFRKSEAFRTGAIDPQTLDPSGLEDPFGFVFGQLLEVQEHSLSSTDALRDQLTSFLEACRGEHPPEVPGEDGLRAVRLADRIQSEVQHYLAREADRAGIQLPRPGRGAGAFQERRTERYGPDDLPPGAPRA